VKVPDLSDAGPGSGRAEYRIAGSDLDILERCWAELARRFPDSTWWTRADVFDMPDAE
jgi:hypothetical protein